MGEFVPRTRHESPRNRPWHTKWHTRFALEFRMQSLRGNPRELRITSAVSVRVVHSEPDWRQQMESTPWDPTASQRRTDPKAQTLGGRSRTVSLLIERQAPTT
jgi:hypothetical protein